MQKLKQDGSTDEIEQYNKHPAPSSECELVRRLAQVGPNESWLGIFPRTVGVGFVFKTRRPSIARFKTKARARMNWDSWFQTLSGCLPCVAAPGRHGVVSHRLHLLTANRLKCYLCPSVSWTPFSTPA